QPWIDIDTIERAEDAAHFDDVAVQLLQRAEELTEAGEHELAEQDYAAALDKSLPEHARIAVLYRRALNLFAAGAHAQGVPYLAQALKVYEHMDGDELPVPRARMHHAMARAQQVLAERSSGEEAQEHYQKGIEHARAAITQRPDLGRAHAVLGICLAGIGQLDQARLRCHRAVRMLPEDADVRWHLGRIYHQQKDYDLAVETLKRAIDLAPKDYRIHKTIAAVYFDRGRSSGKANTEDIVLALREYDIAIRLEPEDPDLFYLSGQVIEYAAEEGIEVRIGSQMVPATPELAVKRYIQCLAVDATYAPAHVELGGYYRQQEQHADALSHYQSAVDLRPKDIELRSILGAYYWELDRLSEAYATYLEIHQLQPGHVPTKFALQRLSALQDQLQQGLSWGQQVLQAEPDHYAAHTWQAELLQRSDQAREAIQHAERVVANADDQELVQRAQRVLVLANWQLDNLDQVVAAGQQLAEADAFGSDAVRIAYTWSQSRDQQPAELLVSAQQLVKAVGEKTEALELLAVAYDRVGAYPQAKQTLEQLSGKIASDVFAYRMGMVLFHWGPEYYEMAIPYLQKADDLRTRRQLLADARSQVRDALRTIQRYQQDQQRAARQRAIEQRRRQQAEERARREAERKQQ
ncbi:MAG: tetratricopeptide repeat protein, partial [Planctomycetota bacterium]